MQPFLAGKRGKNYEFRHEVRAQGRLKLILLRRGGGKRKACRAFCCKEA